MVDFPLPLLHSHTRARVLALLFTNPERSYYLREISRLLDVHPFALMRELDRLEREGVVASEHRGKQRFIRVNTRYPLFRELRDMIKKTVGAEALLRELVQPEKSIERAYLFGSYATNAFDAASDIDLLVVGTPQYEEFQEKIAAIERRLQREINATIMSPQEFRRRRRQTFLRDVFHGPHIVLKG